MATKKNEEAKQERPCWYKIADIRDEAFDDEVAPHLRPKGYDEELAPPTACLDKLLKRLAKRYDTGLSCEKKPIERQPDLLRESYCPDYRTYMISMDEGDRHLIMWKKSVVH